LGGEDFGIVGEEVGFIHIVFDSTLRIGLI
jgi:hypothetical protein